MELQIRNVSKTYPNGVQALKAARPALVDQIAVASAPLRRSWIENGRRYFHYESDTPLPFGASIFSAKYAVVEDRWCDPSTGSGQGVDLRSFHHPGHARNPGRMIESMKASLDYYTKTFGPYQFRELRIVEIPPYSINGRALATTIAFAEQHFITRVREGRGDMTFFGTAHEVAHSWWGGQLRRAEVPGAAVLSESLSNYSAMMVTEKILGPNEARRIYDFRMDRYLSRRSAFQTEVPLPDLFETVTLWDVQTVQAVSTPTGEGQYEVTLDVLAKKLKADSAGPEIETPMGDFVEIGLFAAGTGDSLGALLYLQRHRIHSGRQTIHITVPRGPARAGIDPWRKLIEREREDAVIEVKAVDAGDAQ